MLDRAAYLEHFAADVERMSETLASVDLAAPVRSCPGWTVVDLIDHVGFVHRWAAACATDAAPPGRDALGGFAWPGDRDEPSADDLSAWFRAGADRIAGVLRDLDLDGPTWHPFPTAHVGAVWPRRQAHEISVHRWDLDSTTTAEPSPVDAVLASDGIDEYFELAVPRLVARDDIALPTGSLHVHCTDVAGEWLTTTTDGSYELERRHAKGDAALRGNASDLLLALWGRLPVERLDVVGDADVAKAWLAISGM
ncbi:MAG: maleylpyruvate isomerase family mycothiol-dependent enzyme [Acidimicrobiales bacterium]